VPSTEALGTWVAEPVRHRVGAQVLAQQPALAHCKLPWYVSAGWGLQAGIFCGVRTPSWQAKLIRTTPTQN